MNWQQLKYFEVLAQEKHYTRAAEQLCITQPALSKAIQNLEQIIGVPLFEQRKRGLELTRYGKIFNDYVRRGIGEIDEGVKTLHSMVNKTSGTVHLGSIYTIMSEFLPGLIRDFLNMHPNIKFFTRQQSTVESLAYLLDDVIDLAFTAEYMADKYPAVDRCVVNIEEVNIAVPLNHPLANAREIKFSDITGETFVYYNDSTGMIHSLEEILSRAGYNINDLNISFRATEDNSILGFVKAGLGIAFIADAPNVNTSDVAILKLSDLYLYRKIYMSWRRDNYMPPVVNIFRNYVMNSIAKDKL